MNKTPEKFKKLADYLTKACQSLKWEYEPYSELLTILGLNEDEALAFQIDNVTYMVSESTEENKTTPMYSAFTTVRFEGNRDEPPSEDEIVLKGNPTKYPEHLAGRVVDAHWGLRRQWALENMVPDPSDEEQL